MPTGFGEEDLLERLRAAERVASPNRRVVRIDRAAYLEPEEAEKRGKLDEATMGVVEKLGGRLGKVQVRSLGRRAGRQVAGPPAVVWFYEVPFEALKKK